MHDRSVEVDIELPPDAAKTQEPTAMDVYAVEKSGESHKLNMKIEQRGPGHWVARGRSNGEPVIIARARDSRGALMAEAVGREDRTPEVTGTGVDLYVANELARIGEGRVQPTPVETLARTAKPAKTLVATWPYALVAAAGLVLLDLLLRRLADRRKQSGANAKRIDANDREEATPLKAAA